jgi:hypothetical protein
MRRRSSARGPVPEGEMHDAKWEVVVKSTCRRRRGMALA